MIFKETPLSGAYVIDIEKNIDERGFFARTWCRDEFKKNNLSTELAQFSISFNIRKGTLRGMHLQVYPNEEIKIVRCTAGSIYDVII
jgi:dTDP-4-dehydrorhamnose 3,5-epimerase